MQVGDSIVVRRGSASMGGGLVAGLGLGGVAGLPGVAGGL
ncbi:MAG: hypothetical protein RI897_1898 [Verrucomicrobiota bacterium]